MKFTFYEVQYVYNKNKQMFKACCEYIYSKYENIAIKRKKKYISAELTNF